MTNMRSNTQPQFDRDGLLKDPATWSEGVAVKIAARMGVAELTDTHWKIILSLRAHYKRFGVPPAPSQICLEHGLDKNCAHDLFHSALAAWKVAGLPNPGEEAKEYLNDM